MLREASALPLWWTMLGSDGAELGALLESPVAESILCLSWTGARCVKTALMNSIVTKARVSQSRLVLFPAGTGTKPVLV